MAEVDLPASTTFLLLEGVKDFGGVEPIGRVRDFDEAERVILARARAFHTEGYDYLWARAVSHVSERRPRLVARWRWDGRRFTLTYLDRQAVRRG